MTEPPARRPRAAMIATVVRTQPLAPSMVRVVVGGAGLAGFQPSPCADSYVKLVFPPAGSPAERPLDAQGRVDLEALGALLPADQPVRLRSYTVRAWDAAAGELTLDFVVHGDQGLAGPWAASARPGDELLLLGPGGAWSPPDDAAWHLLVADESALPAVAVALERLPAGARAVALLEVEGPGDQVPIDGPADRPGDRRAGRRDVDVRWVHRAGRPVGQALVESVRALDWPAGMPHAFVHGEAGFVKELRGHLRQERSMPREHLSISGYWRLGTDDEGWRARKREWTREIDEREAAAGLR
ncbi:siderophore-interacting protein [uncultured Cellulomonas sp.]|uniref:siderophore-interacting protein n=1 Tax=uncultured Cellulomonas sp. TaxID=189682 RepID=UPI00261F4526|nr:siderophore-interacting protein [uncultured Cellulomonas sp.]